MFLLRSSKGKAAADRAVTIAYEMKCGLDRGHSIKIRCLEASKAVQVNLLELIF